MYTTFLMSFLYFMQDQLLYFPDRYELSVVATASQRGNLRAWPSVDSYRGFMAANPTRSGRGTLVVIHGNAGSALDRTYYSQLFLALGFRVVLLEYPGYGAREGKRDETGLIADAAHSLRLLRSEYGQPIYVLGESLGAAVAAGSSATPGVLIDGLILCTPWDDLLALAKIHYGFLPVRTLLRDYYDSVNYLKSFHGPLVVIVAERDEIVPRKSSQRLYEAYQGPKKLWTLAGSHNTWLGFTDRRWWARVIEFLQGGEPPSGSINRQDNPLNEAPH